MKNQLNNNVKIYPCDCKHPFQDEKYGKGMRVHNNAPAKGNQKSRFRCTVCLKERTINNQL